MRDLSKLKKNKLIVAFWSRKNFDFIRDL